jgi:acetyl esterase/lipase
MKKRSALAVFLLACPWTTAAPAADAPSRQAIELWPDKPPGDDSPIEEEKATRNSEGTITRLTNISRPTMTVCRPESDKANGLAIVVCPGGGYNMLAWDHEGEQVARWLNDIGVTAVLLKYRVPRRPGTPRGEPPKQALMDAQRAVSLTRSHASDWGIDPKRIGILGFSAGGHLASWTSTNDDRRAYDAIDDADKTSCRPDFAVVIYPGGVVKRGEHTLAPEIRVDADTPPMFLAMSDDDPVNSINAVLLYLALKEAKVPAELHIYATGGHGYGMRKTDHPSSSWPKRCEEWLAERKLLEPSGQ